MPDTYLNKMRATFENRYEKGKDVWSQDAALRSNAGRILKWIKPKSGINVLDIGAGPALDAPAFLELGCKYTAIDLVKHPAWNLLKANYPHQFLSLDIAFQELTETQIQTYDLIFENGCFHHQRPEDLSSFLNCTRELLKNNGHFSLCVYTPAAESDKGETKRFADGRFAHVWNIGQLIDLVSKSGFGLRFSERVPHQNGRSFYLHALFQRQD